MKRCFLWGRRKETLHDVEDDSCAACVYMHAHVVSSEGGVAFVVIEDETGKELEIRRVEQVSAKDALPRAFMCERVIESELVSEMNEAQALFREPQTS